MERDYQGMRLLFLYGENTEEHWHPEIDVLFTAQGRAAVHLQGRTVQMEEEDIFLINSSLPHSVKCEEKTVLCCAKYPWRMVADLLGTGAVAFRCSSAEDKSRPYHDIRSIFRALAYYYLKDRRRTGCLLDSYLLKLLDCLIEHYLVEISPGTDVRMGDEARLQQIFQYVNQHFRESVRLTDLASEMFISPSTLSRFFKKEMGMGFVDYVNEVRIHAAAMELEGSEENVTKVAVNCGFSNLSVFNRAFRERQGVSPTEYRRLRREARESEQRHLDSIRGGSYRTDSAALPADAASAGRWREIPVEADASGGTRYARVWEQAVNIGPVHLLLQAGMQNHVLKLAEELGYTYVRLWDVLSKNLMIADGEHMGGYNYSQLDSALDFLVNHHLRPYFDFGRRPNTITRDEKGFVIQEETYIPFRSGRAWEHLVRDFLRHISGRYGRDEVSRWIFEISYIFTANNSDAIYQDAEPFEFLNAFSFFYGAVKAEFPSARVGGPGAIPGWMEERQGAFLAGCRERGCVPDFWSVVLYPYQSEEKRDSPIPRRSDDPRCEEEQLRRTREFLREMGCGSRLYVSEWNITVSDRNYLNDSACRAAYFAQKLPVLWDLADLIAVSVGSDLLGSHLDTYRVASGGMGILTTTGIRKPAFLALQLLGRLGPWLAGRGENYAVTRAQDGSIYILCSNLKQFNSSYYMRSEASFEPGRLDELFEDLEPIELTFSLKNMPRDAVCAVKARSITENGGILGEWKKLQFEDDLTPHDIQYLRETAHTHLSMSTHQAQGGTLRFTRTVEANEVVLLHVYARE